MKDSGHKRPDGHVTVARVQAAFILSTFFEIFLSKFSSARQKGFRPAFRRRHEEHNQLWPQLLSLD